eukprot:CAMPEP_0118901032 /NCGR_PEP_ID=MMETSP1166-20130328/6896_1 /TAXON_ID=1104430 /ORGANISM="Chrysoreinhardia sp, Strain CCMP3193" /LENGTH=303 /DNA_ID=CAMNT_0006840191 /DNA_START=37 /DNA_END=948 /DNA_ORIENTATION=+
MVRRRASRSFEDRVVVEEAKGVATVRLNRPAKLNALDMAMFRGLRDAAKYVATTKARAVVLLGEGRAFCSGLDVKGLSPFDLEEALTRKDGAASNLVQDVSYLWRKVPAPVIAATHGVCFGGGFQVALGCDLRISSPDCKFSIMEAKWGLIPDMALTTSIPNLAPRDVAMDLTFTGRIFTGDEAKTLGLVTRLHNDPVSAALELAHQISTQQSPDATAAAKKLLHATYDDARTLHLETEIQRKLLGSWNQLAKSAHSLKLLPGLLVDRNATKWSQEADDKADAILQDILDGRSDAHERTMSRG